MAEELQPYSFVPEGGASGNSSKGYTGRGLATYPNGETFEGDYVEGQRHGKGRYTYVNGDKYEGDIDANLKHGIGKMTYNGKGEYSGQWDQGKRSGEGLYTYGNKDVYSGHWQAGKKHGQGTYVFNDTAMRYNGIWHENRLRRGKWLFSNGTQYEGPFENNKPSGQGVWTFANGNKVDGSYSQTIVPNHDIIYRISFKASKVYQLIEREPIIALAFNEDTSLFYYAQDNQITVMKPSCNTKVISQKLAVKDFWVGDYFRTSIRELVVERDDHKLNLQRCPVTATDQETLDRLAFFEGHDNLSSMFVSWDQQGHITGSLSVVLPLFHLQSSVGEVLTAFATANYDEFHVVGCDDSQLRIDVYDTRVLKEGAATIMRQGYQIAYLSELFTFLRCSLQQLYTHLQDIVKIFHLNIVTLVEDLYKKSSNNSISVSEELLKFLRFGVCSQEIQVFLSKELNDTKVLQRVDEKITSSFQQIHDIIADSSVNVLNDMIRFITKLIGYGDNPLYGHIALNKQNLHAMKDEVAYLIEVLDELRSESAEVKLHLRNFFVWLNKNVIKNQGEQETEIENTKSHLVKYQCDIRRLDKFLSDDYLFKLQNLQAYYSSKHPFNAKYLTRRTHVTTTKPQTHDIVDEALLDMTNNFHANLLAYTGTLHATPTPPQAIESERPRLNLPDCVVQAQRIWEALFTEMVGTLSSRITLKKTIRVSDSRGFKLPLRRSFDLQAHYKIAFLRQQHESSTDAVTEVIVDVDSLTSRTVVYQQLPNYVINEISYDQHDELLLLLKLINVEKVHQSAHMKDIIDEKPHHLIAQVAHSSTTQLTIASQQKFETGSINLLTSSRKGLICVVSDEKMILVLTQ